MIWFVFLMASCVALLSTLAAIIVTCCRKKKLKHYVNRLQVLFACCFVMAVLLCIPPYYTLESNSDIAIIKTIVFSFQKAIRVFGADEMYDVVLDNISHAPEKIREIYSIATLCVQFIAPLLTFSFIISFLKNLLPYNRYKMLFWKETHIFSELNEKTLTLARSIITNAEKETRRIGWFRKPLIVFAGVNKDTEEDNDLMADARLMDAIVFKSDLETIHFRNRLWKRKMKFYLISERESNKIRHATSLIESYDFDEVSMYVFSDGIECELLMSAWDNKNMKVYSINDVQSLIYHNLSEHGIRLFRNAHSFNRNVISTVIIGLGKYGMEMLKALIWYGQVCGFELKINVFDADPLAETKFMTECPEIVALNRNTIEGEAHYDITIHNGINVNGFDFVKKIEEINDATYVFVSLGADEENISTAVALRAIYERINHKYQPDIETVVYDTNISREMGVAWEGDSVWNEHFDGIKNFKQQAYKIHMIGDLDSFYAENTVIDSDLVKRGQDVNRRWARSKSPEERQENEKAFWRYDYNYRSSIAKALHEDLRRKLVDENYIKRIPGVEKDWNSLNDEEKHAIGMAEHIRWNAYMRTEGYQFGEKRNDLAKQHHNLVPVGELSDDDLRKDA